MKSILIIQNYTKPVLLPRSKIKLVVEGIVVQDPTHIGTLKDIHHRQEAPIEYEGYIMGYAQKEGTVTEIVFSPSTSKTHLPWYPNF